IEEPAVEEETTPPKEITEPEAAEEEAKPETALEAAEPETTEAEEPAVAEEAAPVEEVTESDEIDELRDLVKRKRSDHVSRLKLARMLWQGGEVEEAMDHYSRLIRSSAKTDDVISDLEHYVEARPDEPRVLRTLGDAYMKFGELDRALAIFNRAMDLL
ncbi:MAG: tetratricopeptide repeat protein, partial [Anaerolineae bacterium]